MGHSTTDTADEGHSASAADADNPPEPASCGVEVACEPDLGTGAPPDTAWLGDRLAAAIALVGRPVERVTVRIVGEARMRALHRRHRDDPGATDVLAFQHSEPGAPVDADIVVCADVARRLAADMNHTVEQELLLYALHGVLHCAGFDDHDEAGYRAMHAEEDRILAAIGVGPTFKERPGD